MAREYELRRVQRPWTKAHQDFISETRRLNLATVVRTNLYALPGPLAYPMAVGSMTSFLMAIRGVWAGRLRIAEFLLQSPDFHRKPVAEMLGLGIAMEAAREYGWDGAGPQSLDSLRQYWGDSNSRPDLLFTRTNSDDQFVAEAKGKTLSAVRPSAPHSDERKWLEKLESWYGDLGLQYFLLVAMAAPDRVVANLYDPGEPRAVYPREALQAAVASRETLLWNTSPLADLRIGDRELRGRWATVVNDVVDDEGITSFLFLGITDERVQEDIESEREDVQISAAGRVVVVLRRGSPGESLPESSSVLDDLFSQDHVQILRGGEVIASGRPTPGGDSFVVLAGSESRASQSSAYKADRVRREELRRSGVLHDAEVWASSGTLVFTEDVRFRSSSAAARLVLGTAAGGPGEWHFSDGTSLRNASR